MPNANLGKLSVLMMRRMDKQSCLDLIQALKQQPRLTRVYDMSGIAAIPNPLENWRVVVHN